MTEHYIQFPDLSGVKQICLDLETRDPNLKTRGVGGVRGDGQVLGFALAWREPVRTSFFGLDPGVKSVYLPIAHSAGNLDRHAVIQYLNEQLGRNIPVVGANLAYDLEWCRREGVTVTGLKRDVQIAEALLDENRKSYSLNALSKRWLGETKLTDEMGKRCAPMLGCKEAEVITHLARLPADEVAAYATNDAEMTLRIMELQDGSLRELRLKSVWDLECKLVQVLQDMRWLGVRLDVSECAALQLTLAGQERVAAQAMRLLVGSDVNPWSHDEVQAAAESLHLTGLIVDGNGKQSFPAPWMAKQPHDFFRYLLQLRQLSKVGGAFLTSFLELQHEGRLHCQYHQTRGDRGGTRSGRLSASLPNLQQIPSRNEELAPRIRSLFLPEKGQRFVEADFSQVEPRIGVHYASALQLPGAEEAVRAYTDDPTTDYHAWVAGMTGLPRFQAKVLNLALAYGAGKAKMAELVGLTVDEITPLFDAYHEGVPFVRALSKACTSIAESRGYVKTILGRRRNLNLWGPLKFKTGVVPKHKKEAIEEWGPGVVRYFTYRASNSVIQGTAADLMKKSLVDLHSSGYVPHLTIHDSVLLSVDKGSDGDRAIENIKGIMENAIEFVVPLKVDITVGLDWGHMGRWEG